MFKTLLHTNLHTKQKQITKLHTINLFKRFLVTLQRCAQREAQPKQVTATQPYLPTPIALTLDLTTKKSLSCTMKYSKSLFTLSNTNNPLIILGDKRLKGAKLPEKTVLFVLAVNHRRKVTLAPVNCVPLAARPQRRLPNVCGNFSQVEVPLLPEFKNTTKSLSFLVDKINRRLSSQEKKANLLPTPDSLRLSANSFSKAKSVKKITRKRFFYNKKHIATISVHSSRNNTLLTLSGGQNKTLKQGWASAGRLGFKNSRKSTTYAAQGAAKSLALRAKQQGIRALHLKLHGSGRAKGAVVRTLQQSSLKVLLIRECTPAVHNGCRRPKIRRI